MKIAALLAWLILGTVFPSSSAAKAEQPFPPKSLKDFILEQGKMLASRFEESRKFSTREEWDRRRAAILAKLRESLGLQEPNRPAPLNARFRGRVETRGYSIEKILFDSGTGITVDALVYIPKDGRFPYPAVVSPIGHWADAKEAHEVQPRMVGLASRGYVALTYDPVGQGERAWLGDHQQLGKQAILCGRSLLGVMVKDTLRAIDYLCTRPDVDPGRIGCTGDSGGGINTLYAAAMDERIKVVVPTGFATSLGRLIEPWNAGCCAFVPNQARYADIDDIYALMAPRPLLLLGGEKDATLFGGSTENYRVALKTYSLFDPALIAPRPLMITGAQRASRMPATLAEITRAYTSTSKTYGVFSAQAALRISAGAQAAELAQFLSGSRMPAAMQIRMLKDR